MRSVFEDAGQIDMIISKSQLFHNVYVEQDDELCVLNIQCLFLNYTLIKLEEKRKKMSVFQCIGR